MLKANNLIMEEYQKSYEERLLEEREKNKQDVEQNHDIPYLTNLNEDILLDRKIYHNFENRSSLLIGKGNDHVKPDI